MKSWLYLAVLAIAAGLSTEVCAGGSSPHFNNGQVLTSSSLNGAFQGKADYPLAAPGAIGATTLGPSARLNLPAPVNLAPNSQWEIFSGMGTGTKENIEGTGTLSTVAARANTTDSTAVTFTTGSTGETKVGDLFAVSGSGVDACLTISFMRVSAVVANTSISTTTPHACAPSGSHPSTITIENVGMSGSTATGDAADGWTKTTALMVWREDNAANLIPGARYALGVQKDSGLQEAVSTQLPGTHTQGPTTISAVQGHTVSFGACVYQKVKGGSGTWNVFISSNGTGGGTVTGAAVSSNTAGACNWEEIAYTVPTDATSVSLGVDFNGNSGDTYYVTDPVVALAPYIGPNNYQKPTELFLPIVHISPMINVSITSPASISLYGYGYWYDNYAETSGFVAPTVLHAWGQTEGVNTGTVITGTGNQRVMAWYSSPYAPNVSGSFLFQTVANVKSFNSWDLPMVNGIAFCVDGQASDTWTNVSNEEDYFLLK
jgi:hypothetical protein